MASLNEILALTRSYDKSDSTAFCDWKKSGTTRISVEDDGEVRLPNATATGQGILLGGDAEIYRSAANVLRTPDSWVIDETLLIGSATAYVAGLLEINKSNAAVITGLNTWNDTDTPGISYHNKSGSDTVGNYAAITTAHLIHRDIYQGADGTDFQPAGEQEWSVTGTVGADRVPGKYILYLYTDAASSVKTTVVTMTAATIAWNTAVPHSSLKLGGALDVNGQTLNNLSEVYSSASNAILLVGRYQNTAANISLYTSGVTPVFADTLRLTISGGAATAVATWSNITHTGLVITSAGTIEGIGTGANGFKLKNLKNAAASALSGVQLDVEIDIGGVPYYFTVYPTKA